MIKIEIEILVNSFLLVLTIEDTKEVFNFDIPLKHETLILEAMNPKEETIEYYKSLVNSKIDSINTDLGYGYSIDGYIFNKQFEKVFKRVNHLFETPYKYEKAIKKNVKVSTILKTLKGLGLPKSGKKSGKEVILYYGTN